MTNLPKAEPISLNELPHFSEWPSRIIGSSEWEAPDRDTEKIEEEYEHDKYARLLDLLNREEVEISPREVKRAQNADRTWHFADPEQSDKTVCISQRNSLFVANVHDAQRYNDSAVTEVFQEILDGDEVVVELGAGYGYNLAILNDEFSGCRFIGGDYSSNAVRISENLFDGENIQVEQFNYYDDDWEVLDREFNRDVIVFTRLSIEQLPSCTSAIETLIEYTRSDVREVIHLEPVHEMHDQGSLLGLLRKGYTEINDYNRDLLSVLNQSARTEIIETEYDIFGFNGLNPMSLIRWRPN